MASHQFSENQPKPQNKLRIGSFRSYWDFGKTQELQVSCSPATPSPTLVCQQFTGMEGTQKPKHFTTPGDHVGLGVLSLQEQRQKEQQVEANVLWGHTRDESSWKEWIGGLARYFLRFRRGDNILVDFNTPPCIWLIMSHSQNQEKWEKTTFQILREDHIPDAQRRPHSRSPEKTTFQILKTMFQIPNLQRRPHSRSSMKTMFQIFRDDHVPGM